MTSRSLVKRAGRLLGDLQRRRVTRVALVYLVVALAAAEAADVFLGNLAPQWALDTALVLLLLGLPAAIVLAWVYDLTPEGLVRDEGAGKGAAAAPAAVAERAEPLAPADIAAAEGRIAVLPLANLSADAENEFFADGITDDILTALTLIDGLEVTSRTSVMRYKGSDKPTRQIAGELGVGRVLEGSIRWSGDRIRIVVQLIDALSDVRVWAETYDRSLEDVFAVQSDVAEQVAEALEVRVTGHGRRRLARRTERNIEAYQLLARARHAYLRVQKHHVDHGMGLLERALEVDPEYPEAWAHYAIAHLVLPYFSTVAPSAIEASAREAIDRAFALDDELPEALVARAFWRFNFRHDWVGADRDFSRALELNPSSADVYQWRGLVHMVCGRLPESIRDARSSVSLDPLSFQTRSQLAQNLTWGGHAEEGATILRGIIGEDPTNYIAHWALGIAVRADDPSAALGHMEEALRHLDVPLIQASRSLTLRILGRPNDADEVVASLDRRVAGQEYVSPFALAVACFGRGDTSGGLDQLERGVEERDFMTLHMRLIASAMGFAEHPRYLALVRDLWPDDLTAVR